MNTPNSLRLTLDVSYALAGMPLSTLAEHVRASFEHAIGNGALSGDTPATVDTYVLNVTQVAETSPQPAPTILAGLNPAANGRPMFFAAESGIFYLESGELLHAPQNADGSIAWGDACNVDLSFLSPTADEPQGSECKQALAALKAGRYLVVDGSTNEEDPDGPDFAGDGKFPPFAVFDVMAQENVAGIFQTREDAEVARAAILAGGFVGPFTVWLDHEQSEGTYLTIAQAADAALAIWKDDPLPMNVSAADADGVYVFDLGINATARRNAGMLTAPPATYFDEPPTYATDASVTSDMRAAIGRAPDLTLPPVPLATHSDGEERPRRADGHDVQSFIEYEDERKATVAKAVQAALDEGCRIVQEALGQTRGDFAGMHFSDDAESAPLAQVFGRYFDAEALDMQRNRERDEDAAEDFTPAANNRTPHKMPAELARQGYRLEYGSDAAEDEHLHGAYWWTLCRAWPECESNGNTFDTPEGAIAEARSHCDAELARGADAFKR